VRTALCLSIVILASTSGELLSAHAMKQSARRQVAGGSAVAMLLHGGFRLSSMWVGLMLQGLAFFTLLALLSWADVSFVVPATALNYVVGAAASVLVFREHVDRTRWAGVLLVCLGVAFICASEL
jgi:drug/metabolite transporter (DMT)-like permease